tara:strand:- start:256 stop:1041 length:786 start_codon:yes stop_codon:yes gene_type:complete
MKKITLLLLSIFILTSCEDWKPEKLTIDWGDKPQPLYEAVTMNPLPGKETDLIEKLKEYNSLYHNKAEDTSAFLRYISSGNDSGKYMWIEGPMDFKYVNERNNLEGRSNYWRKNILPLIVDSKTNFYRHGLPLSVFSKKEITPQAYRVVGFKLFNDNGYEWEKVNNIMYKFKLAEDAVETGYSKHIFYPYEKVPGDSDFYVVFPMKSLAEEDNSDKNENGINDWEELMGKMNEMFGNIDLIWKEWDSLVYRNESHTRVVVK